MDVINLEDYNFEVIDLGNIGKPTMTINDKSVVFSNQVADIMSFPRYISLSFEREKKVLAIKKTTSNARNAIEFSKNRIERDKPVKIQSGRLIIAIREMMNEYWEDEKRYEVSGIFVAHGNIMLFNLKDFESFKIARRKNQKMSEDRTS
jgi:hypothetical protein